MNSEEIIDMAIQAELNLYVHDLTEKRYIEVIEAFAKLVAAKALAQPEPVQDDHQGGASMTQEALKLALDAFHQIFNTTPVYHDDGTCVINNKAVELGNKAIAAIKEALAQPEKEPVAWMRPSEEGYDSAFRDHRTVISCIEGNWIGWIPLYTHPPQEQQSCDKRTWVGLTDEEQRNIAYSDINCWDWGELMDATEAKLKQKNG